MSQVNIQLAIFNNHLRAFECKHVLTDLSMPVSPASDPIAEMMVAAEYVMFTAFCSILMVYATPGDFSRVNGRSL